MNEETFETVKGHIQKAGLSISEAEYHPQTFGSWYIIVSSEPNYRMVWDGKQQWLVVERQTKEIFNGLPVWDEVWPALNAKENDLGKGIDQLISCCKTC